MARIFACITCFFLAVSAVTLLVGQLSARRHGIEHARPPAGSARSPISFVPNLGQTDASVFFLGHSPGGTVHFLPDGVSLPLLSRAVSPAVVAEEETERHGYLRVALRFVGGNSTPSVVGGAKVKGSFNYFVGSDPQRWRSNLSGHRAISYKHLYPGITLDYQGSGSGLKGTYRVASGADPSLVRWRYEGADKVWLDKWGNLHTRFKADSPGGQTRYARLLEKAPIAWQDRAGERRSVKARFKIFHDKTIGFSVGPYDQKQKLTIDPEIAYSTFLGGVPTQQQGGFVPVIPGDGATAIAVDDTGSAYVTGFTNSIAFPTTQEAFKPQFSGVTEAFVTKINPQGSDLVYSTFLGGQGTASLPNPGAGGFGWEDIGWGIALDRQGSAYVTGHTISDFPTTPDAFDRIPGEDVFVTKLDPTGSRLVYSTLLGGVGADHGWDIEVDADQKAYVFGQAERPSAGSPDFPMKDAYEASMKGPSDAFLTKLNSDGSGLEYSTYLGGSDGEVPSDPSNPSHGPIGGLDIDAAGSAYVAGMTGSNDFPTKPGSFLTHDPGGDAQNGFVAKFNPSGSNLDYSTYLGGTGADWAKDIVVDGTGSAHVTGLTRSDDFPLQDAIEPMRRGRDSAFVSKLQPDGSGLSYSTFYGNGAQGTAIDIGEDGTAYIAGVATGVDEVAAFQRCHDFLPESNVLGDAFIAAINPSGSAYSFSSCLGGAQADVALGITMGRAGEVYLAGRTVSVDFPVTPGAYQPVYPGGTGLGTVEGVGFVTKICEDGCPIPGLTIADVTLVEGDSGTAGAGFIVNLDIPSPLPVTVRYATKNGSAVAGEDYLAASQPLVFLPGETTKRVEVLVSGDTVIEPDETFAIELTDPSGARILKPHGIGTIRNDDFGGAPDNGGKGPPSLDERQDAGGQDGPGQQRSAVAGPQPPAQSGQVGSQPLPQPPTQPAAQAQVVVQTQAASGSQSVAQAQGQVQAQVQAQIQPAGQAQAAALLERERQSQIQSERVLPSGRGQQDFLAIGQAFFGLAGIGVFQCLKRHSFGPDKAGPVWQRSRWREAVSASGRRPRHRR